MNRQDIKKDKVIWEAVRMFNGMTLEQAENKPPELVTTEGFIVKQTFTHIYVKSTNSKRKGDWTIIPASLVKRILRG